MEACSSAGHAVRLGLTRVHVDPPNLTAHAGCTRWAEPTRAHASAGSAGPQQDERHWVGWDARGLMLSSVRFQDVCFLGSEARKGSVTSSVGCAFCGTEMVPRGAWAGLAGLALAGRGQVAVSGTLCLSSAWRLPRKMAALWDIPKPNAVAAKTRGLSRFANTGEDLPSRFPRKVKPALYLWAQVPKYGKCCAIHLMT